MSSGVSVLIRPRFGDGDWRPVPEFGRCPVPTGGAMIRVAWGDVAPREIGMNGRSLWFDANAEYQDFPAMVDSQLQLALTVSQIAGETAVRVFEADPKTLPARDVVDGILDFYEVLKERYQQESKPDVGSIEDLPLVSFHLSTGATESFIRAIEKIVPMLQDVCDRPYMRLDMDEQIRPVEIVRRTGPAALRHLASHSEHWETRTVSGLRPARLLAQVVEDNLDLYENRFVRTLLDRIHDIVTQEDQKVGNWLLQANSATVWNELCGKGSRFRWEMLKKLLPFFSADTEANRYEFEQLQRRIRRLSAAVTACRSSRFYQSMRRRPKVQRPIQSTNILTMDPRYAPLRALWLELDELQRPGGETAQEPREDSPSVAYAAFCQTAVIAALLYAGFRPANGKSQPLGDFDTLKGLRSSGDFTRGPWRVTISTKGSVHCRIILTLTRKSPDSGDLPTDVPHPSFTAKVAHLVEIREGKLVVLTQLTAEQQNEVIRDWLESLGDLPESRRQRYTKRLRQYLFDRCFSMAPEEERQIQILPVCTGVGTEPYQIDKTTELLLDEATSKASESISVLVCLPIAPVILDFTLPARIVRRVSNLGDSFYPSDASRWGDYRSGLLPLSQQQIKSVLRVVRLINSHTHGVDIVKERQLDRCPACGSPLRPGYKTADDEDSCYDCGARWARMTCPREECGCAFAYVRPTVPSTVQPLDASESDPAGGYARWLEWLETVGQESAVCGFCESPQVKPAQHPICPRCGMCPRQDVEGAETHEPCKRCRSLIRDS